MTTNSNHDEQILKQTDQYVNDMRHQGESALWRSYYETQAQVLKEARDSSNQSD